MKLHLPFSLRRALLAAMGMCATVFCAGAADIIVENELIRDKKEGLANTDSFTLTATAYAAPADNIGNKTEVRYKNNRTEALVYITTDYRSYYSYPEAYAYGGAIYCNSGLILSGNTLICFEANLAEAYAEATLSNGSSYEKQRPTAKAYGGAIYSSMHDISISQNTHVEFNNNTAYASHPTLPGDAYGRVYAHGGAIANLYGNTSLSYNGSLVFANNAAASGGAAIYSDRGNIDFTGNGLLEIRNNLSESVYTNADLTLCANPAIKAYNNKESVFRAANVSLTGSSEVAFYENHATGYNNGAAIQCDSLALNQNGTLSFTGNTSEYYGGAIYCRDSLQMNGNIAISFARNESTFNAGALHISGIKGSSEILDNDSVIFTDNSANAFYSLENNAASVKVNTSLYGGAITAGSDFTIAQNGVLLFDGNKVSAGGNVISHSAYASYQNVSAAATLGAYGGGIFAEQALNFSENGSITFCHSEVNVQTTATATNYAESDVNCKATGYAYAGGSAIFFANYSGESLWCKNGSISFTDNLAWASSTADSATADIEGGVLNLGKESNLRAQLNTGLTFSQNTIHAEAFNIDAYETSFANWFIGQAIGRLYGGVIAQDTGSKLVFDDNETLRFTDNVSTVRSGNMASVTPAATNRVELTATSEAYGGVIYSNGASCDFCYNERVEFSGNSITSTASMGGRISGSPTYQDVAATAKIWGGAIALASSTLNMAHNSDILFKENTIKVNAVKQSTASAATQLAAYTWGAAIFIDSNSSFTLSNNYLTLFEKNVEINNDSFRLRSIYSLGTLNLSPTFENETVIFYDSITSEGSTSVVNFNNDYTTPDGLMLSGRGQIIFSGKYTELHLNESLQKEGQTRTATTAEINNSRTSYAETSFVHNGRVMICDGAVYSGKALTLLSADRATPTLELCGGVLDFSNGSITLQKGTALQLRGGNNSINAAAFTMENASTLHCILSSGNTSAPLLSFTGSMQISSGAVLFLGCDGALPANGTYRLISVSSVPGSWSNMTINTHLGLQNIRWQNNTLVADFNYATWNNAAGTRKWDAASRNWTNGSSAVAYTAGQTVAFLNSGAGNVALSGNLSPSLVWVENEFGYDYAFAGTGALTGNTQLQKRGAGTLSIGTDNSYSGGTLLYGGTLVAENAKAFGTGKIELRGGTLNLNAKAVGNDIEAYTGTICGGSAYAGKMYVDGSVYLKEDLHAGNGIELRSGALYGKAIIDTNLIINAPNDSVWVDSALTGTCNISLKDGYLEQDQALKLGHRQTVTFEGGHVFGGIDAQTGATLNIHTNGNIEGDLTIQDAQINVDFGGSLHLNGNLNLGGNTLITLHGDYQANQTYTLINAVGNMLVDFSRLTGNASSLGERYGCSFSIAAQSLNVTIVEVGTTLTWAGGPEDIWINGGGVWQEGGVFHNVDTVILKDGTVDIYEQVCPSKVYMRPQSKLTITTTTWGYIAGEQTSVIIEAAPGATVIFDSYQAYGGGTIIRSGNVTMSKGSGPINLEGGSLNINNERLRSDITVKGQASILKGKNYTGTFTLAGGELLKGSVLSSYKDMYLQGGVMNGTLTCQSTVHVTGASEIGATGKLNTGTLHICEGGTLTTSTKGLSLNAKTAELIFDGGKLVSLNKLSAYTLTMNGGHLDIANAKPMALTITDEAALSAQAHIDIYGKFTAACLQMNQASLTMNMAEADITAKNQPKPQSLTLKNKTATNSLTSSQLTLNGSISVAGHLSLTNTAITVNDPSAKPKALGVTVKGNLDMQCDSTLYATGKISLAALDMNDSAVILSNAKPQTLALTGKADADKKPIYNNIVGSTLLLNGSMSVAANLVLNNATIQLRDAYTAKPKALALAVKGDLTLGGNSLLYLSGALSAKNLTLGSGSIYMTGEKLQTIKVSNELTLNGGTSLNFGFSITQKDFDKNKAFKILTFKVLDAAVEAADLYSLLGLSEDICTLAFDKSRKSITLVVEDMEEWNKQAEAVRKGEIATAAEAAEDMLFAPGTDAAVLEPELAKVTDTLVQSTWGTVGASRAFGDTIANRGAHATLLDGGKGAAWISTMGGSSRISSDGAHAGADYTLTGAAFGMEAHITADSVLGLAVGNSWGKVSTFSAYPVDQDSTHMGIYGNHKLSDTLSLSWMAAHTRTESDVNLAGLPCSWSQDALQLDARLTWARALTARTTVNAFGGLQYLATDSGESNGIKTGSLQNLRAEIGVGATHKLSGSTLAYGELSFVGDMVRNNPTADLGGIRSHGSTPGRAGMNLSVGASHRINDSWCVNAAYNFEQMQNITSHSLNIGATYSF